MTLSSPAMPFLKLMKLRFKKSLLCFLPKVELKFYDYLTELNKCTEHLEIKANNLRNPSVSYLTAKYSVSESTTNILHSEVV